MNARHFAATILIVLFTLTLAIAPLRARLMPLAVSGFSGSNFYEEITGLPFWPRIVDVNSHGHIFVLSLDNDVWRSQDNGVSWTKVLDDGRNWGNVLNVTTRNWLTLYVNSKDYVFANILEHRWRLYRSIDGGSSWTDVSPSGNERSWHMDESSNGTLWYHRYTATWATIWKSNDDGMTWTVFHNFTLPISDLRTVAVNDYNDKEVWAGTGVAIYYWNGSAWITMNYNLNGCPSAFWFDSDYVYTGSEVLKANWRYPHQPSPPSPIPSRGTDVYWDAGELSYAFNEHSFEGLRIDNIMLFGIRSQLWGSWDGKHWAKVVDLGEGTTSDIMSISHRNPIYFTDKKQGRLYRLNIQKEDIVKLYYTEYNSERGLIENKDDYVLEQRVSNGTNCIDLTNVALSDVQVSIKGLSRRNQILTSDTVANSGWEWGNTTGWYVSSGAGSYGVASVTTEEAANGTRSLKVVKGANDTQSHSFVEPAGVTTTVKKGEILLVSAYVKGNISSANRVLIYYTSKSQGNLQGTYFNLSTSWTRIVDYFPSSRAGSFTYPLTDVQTSLWTMRGVAVTVYWDSILVQRLEVGAVFSGGQGENAVQFLEGPSSYHTSDLDSVSPTLSIGGQIVSHSGALANGTASAPQNLTGIFTGVIPIWANIQGSGQAILRLTGRRLFYEDSVILFGRTDEVYYGRYYDVFMPNTTTTDLIVVTNLFANITSLSCVSDELIFTVNSPFSITTLSKVYVGDKGQPENVSGATSSSYDPTNKILTMTALHSSSTTIIVSWRVAPTGSITIAEGATYTNSMSVTLTLSAYDNTSTVAEMHFSHDNMSWSNWEEYATSRSWTLTTSDGTKTVYVQFKGNTGLISQSYLDTIILDTTKPTASAGTDQTINEDTPVTFDASGSTDENGIATYTWTFADAGASRTLDGVNPDYTFGSPGVYTVTLNVTDVAENFATDTLAITVLDTTKPSANAGSDLTANEDALVVLDGSASLDNVATAAYTWTFTDVTTKTLTGEKPAYTFNTPGIYAIMLNVTDAAGNWATDTVILTILDVTRPIANAGQDQIVGVGSTVDFDAGTSTDNVGIVSYEWDFGDANTGMGKTTTHVYAREGTYSVVLTAKDAAGNTATDTMTITVHSTDIFHMWVAGAMVATMAIASTVLSLRKRRVRKQHGRQN